MPYMLTRTTLTLPTRLIQRVDRAVRAGQARSRTAFIAEAIARGLASQEHAAVGEAFAAMADDADYLSESAQLDTALATAGALALRLTEPGA